MKPLLSVLLTLIAATALVHSQDGSVSDASVSTAASNTARILGEIPDGTPPPPTKPKPEYKVAKSDVLQTTTHEQGGRSITVQRIKPIDLPLPPQPAQASADATEVFSQRVAEYREEHPRSGLMFVGATVYRSGDQPPAR